MKALSPQQIDRLQQMLMAARQASQAGLQLQAERLYLDILKTAPEAYDVRHELAVLLATSGRPQDATVHFRAILKGNPAHAPTHANLANALSESGEMREAAAEFKRALALDSTMVGAHIALGMVLRRQGDFAGAVKSFRSALDLDAKSAFAFNGLGLAYRDLDDLPRALECLEHAVGLAPDVAEFRINLGVTLRRAELDQWAVDQFYKAVGLAPDMLDAVVLLGDALDVLNRHDEARECFDRALQLKPGEPEIYERRAFVYMEMGDSEQAVTEFTNVLEHHPNRFMALRGLGQTHMLTGNSVEAAACFGKLISLYPEDAAGYVASSGIRKFKKDDPIIPQLLKILEKTPDDDPEAIGLNFALGKIYDDCKEWDLSFSHYAKGNRLKNLTYDYKPDADKKQVDEILSVFTKDYLDTHADFGIDSTVPVIIVGMPRSGTTLTEQIVSSHPQVIGAGEVVFWGKASKAVPHTLHTRTAYPACMLEMTPDKAREIAEKYTELLQKIAGPKVASARITDKMPHNFMQLGLIALLLPNARIIHCKRDAMDNCLSVFFQNFKGDHPYAYDLANLGHHHQQYERLMAHWHNVLPGRILDIHYEDTIADPEYWSRKLIEHVGLEWDDACLAPHKLDRMVKTASHWQVRQPIYNTSVQRWKNYEKYLEPLKVALGY